MTSQIKPHSKLSPEDLALIRTIGSRLRHIIKGSDIAVEDIDRLDELGILSNLVNRVAKELRNSRLRDEQHRKELEQRLAEVQQLYQTQQQLVETIQELSAPVLDIYNGVLLLPIIGVVDGARAAQLVSVLLNRVEHTRASIVILDVTGVASMDTDVTNILISMAQAVKLLGARVILCGISPEVAQVIVSLGIDLSTFTTCSDLRAALKQALSTLGARITYTRKSV